MDITQLKYFVSVVEYGCNLSLAAKKIHISQSALSQMISNFERDEQLELFYRKNGRLKELTPSGQRVYEAALSIVSQHNQMQELIRKEASKQRGTIRIGLPSLILRIYFTSFFSQFIVEHPETKIEIIEDGSYELRRMILQKDLDFAVLIDPTNLNPKDFEEHVIQIDEVTAFMRHDHPLAKYNMLKWPNLENYAIATFMDSFVTNGLVKEKLNKYNVKAEILFASSSWDFLVETTQHGNTVAILPSPIYDFVNGNQFIEKHFNDPIPFNVFFCRPIKKDYTAVEQLVHQAVLGYFYQPVN